MMERGAYKGLVAARLQWHSSGVKGDLLLLDTLVGTPLIRIFDHFVFGRSCGMGGVETYYCLRQAVGDDLVFEVEIIDPEDEQRDMGKEE